MALTTANVIRLVFNTSGGKTFAISLTDPKDNLDRDTILAVMNQIIEKNIFLTVSGELTGVRDIRVVNTTSNDMYDPPQT